MATLVVYQGEAIDREVDLGENTLTVGRGDDNELVLSDPVKSVSRHHAELRFEQGKYSIVDLKSQNGIWVGGRRVSTAELEPGIPVVIGSFRLMLKASQAPLASDATILAPASGIGAATILITPSANPHALAAAKAAASATPKPEPPVVAAKPTPPPPAPRPAPVSAAPTPAPAPPPPAPVAPAPAPAAVVAKVAEPQPSEKANASGKGMPKRVLVAVAALLLLAISSGVILMMRRNRAAPPVETTAAIPVTPPAPVDTPVTPSVTAESAPPPPPEQPAAPVAPKPSPAEKEPGTVASDARGGAPPQKPAPPARGRGRNTGPVPPTQTTTPPKQVLPDLTGMFEEARTAMIKGDYVAAITGFENVLKTDPNYPNAANLLDVARGGARNASQLAVDAGNKAEMSADYLAAMKQYERALQLDVKSTSAPEAVRRLKVRMQREGEAAFASAKQYDAGDRAKEAIAAYERALQLLPADHPSVSPARDRLAVLKR